MVEIAEYIRNDKSVRQAHLKLNEKCSEIGGNSSTEFKGLLAYYLNTTIPCSGNGYKILLCHACNNSKCSNVNHLYWGTPSENIQDAKANGTWINVNERTRQKYGEDGLKLIAAKAGKNAGISNRKPDEYWETFREEFTSIEKTRGWISKLSKKFNLSHSHIRRIAKKLNIS